MGFFDDIASGLAGGLGSGAISTGLNAISSIFSNKSQKKENQRNRDFAEYMYNKQIDNNIKMWNMQNEYNLPKNMISRMKQAGLNPDLMYSGSGISPSPNLQAAVAGSPSTSALPPGALLGESAMQGALTAAQIRNIDADTEKKVEETKGQGFTNIMLASDASIRDQLNSGILAAQGLELTLTGKKIAWTDADIARLKADTSAIQKSVEVMNQNITESAQRVANMKLDEISKSLDNYIKQNSLQDQLRIIAAQAHISEVEAKYAVAKICSELAVNASKVNANNASANASNASARLTNLHWNIGQMEYNLRDSAGYYNLVVDSDTESLRASIAGAKRGQKRDTLIAGDGFFGNYIFPAVDATTNLIGGVFGASVSYSKSAPRLAIGPYDAPNSPSH